MPVDLSPADCDLLALTLVPGIGPKLTSALLERFGSATAVRQASNAQLCEVPHIGQKLATQLLAFLQTFSPEPTLQLLQAHATQALLLAQPNYPAVLKLIPDPPHVLYMRGSYVPEDVQAVGLVGSRQCTSYGKRVAERLATGLAQAGYTVISGLARGIDGVAHQAALAAGGRTLAVLANGLGRMYPPEHKELAQRVAAQGALFSEAPLLQEPFAGMFPARNRLIAGLSRAVVVIEAAEKSGALITATHAAEQGRLVFAVPGPIDSPASSGTNALLRKGATLCRSVDDLLEELNSTAPLVANALQPAVPLGPGSVEKSGSLFADSQATSIPVGLDAKQQQLWELLTEPLHLDTLAERLGWPMSEVMSTLFMLEMKKVVARLPGNRVERR